MKASNGNGKGSKPRHCPDWRKLGKNWDDIDWRTPEQKAADLSKKTLSNELKEVATSGAI